jgi:hypothetical protein
MARKPASPKRAIVAGAGVAALQGFAKVFTSIVETFGWPGGLLVLGYSFVVQNATVDQKQRIIEMYVLGHDVSRIWPIALVCFVALCTILAQNRSYKKKLNKLSDELEREGNEKSALQQVLTGQQLQHAQTKTIPGRK